MLRERPLKTYPKRASFDVICAGEAHWRLHGASISAGSTEPLDFRAGGGALYTALRLREWGLHVGLATVIEDDSFGRELVERIALRGIDVGGVSFTHGRSELVVVEKTARSHEVVSFREFDSALEVPDAWSARVLLLAGLSPVVPYAAALCKAARAARRQGTPVVVAIDARRGLWRDRDPRAVRMVLREADVARCTDEDLEVLGLDIDALRSVLRETAVLVVTRRSGDAWALGPFGETRRLPRNRSPNLAPSWKDAPDPFAAAICAELARADSRGDDRSDLWDRVLSRGCAALEQQPTP
jgi:sugar/nucleoside kinase (ribokinase family)